jgi:hypothetical protein
MTRATKVTPLSPAEQLAQDIWLYVRVTADRSPLSSDTHCKEIARMIEASKIDLFGRVHELETEHARHERGRKTAARMFNKLFKRNGKNGQDTESYCRSRLESFRAAGEAGRGE